MIPEEALATDQGQRFVYVIGDDNRVVYRRVQVGMLVAARAHQRRAGSHGPCGRERIAAIAQDLEVDPPPLSSEKMADAPADNRPNDTTSTVRRVTPGKPGG